MIKRGRPKGATAYPEHAVCIKCQVFRPKRRGYCDRCRPRNRGAAAKTAANLTTSPATTLTPSSPSAASSAGLTSLVPSEHQKQPRQDHDAMVVIPNSPAAVTGQSAGDDRPAASTYSVEGGSRGVKRQRHNAVAGGQQKAAQIRGKRRRTVSAPVSANNNHSGSTNSTHGRVATPLMMVSSAMQALERNRNVDVVSAYAAAAAGATAKDRKPDASSPYHSTSGSAAHQLALLLPRSDGTAVDVVPLQFLSTASPTATAASSSSPTSSPSVTSSTHSLMSLANVSALAAARYPSPTSNSSFSSWSSSPPPSPPRQLLHSSPSPYSSPPASSSSSSSPSFALPHPRPSGGSGSHNSRAGDLVLPSLGSLALPRPALPLHFFPAHASAGLHLASMVAPAAPLRLAPN